MALHTTCEIEFIGGPVDGCAEHMVLPLDPFIGVTTVVDHRPVALFAALLRLLHRQRPAAVRLSVYEAVERHPRPPCYRYVATQVVTETRLRDGYGLNTVAKRLSESAS